MELPSSILAGCFVRCPFMLWGSILSTWVYSKIDHGRHSICAVRHSTAPFLSCCFWNVSMRKWRICTFSLCWQLCFVTEKSGGARQFQSRNTFADWRPPAPEGKEHIAKEFQFHDNSQRRLKMQNFGFATFCTSSWCHPWRMDGWRRSWRRGQTAGGGSIPRWSTGKPSSGDPPKGNGRRPKKKMEDGWVSKRLPMNSISQSNSTARGRATKFVKNCNPWTCRTLVLAAFRRKSACLVWNSGRQLDVVNCRPAGKRPRRAIWRWMEKKKVEHSPFAFEIQGHCVNMCRWSNCL